MGESLEKVSRVVWLLMAQPCAPRPRLRLSSEDVGDGEDEGLRGRRRPGTAGQGGTLGERGARDLCLPPRGPGRAGTPLACQPGGRGEVRGPGDESEAWESGLAELPGTVPEEGGTEAPCPGGYLPPPHPHPAWQQDHRLLR